MKEISPLGPDSARGEAEKLSDAREPDEQRMSDAEQNPYATAVYAEEIWQLKFERESLWRRVSDLTEAERMLRAEAEVLKNELHSASEADRMLRAEAEVLKNELHEAVAAKRLHANSELALNALLMAAREKTTELNVRIADLEKMIGTLKLAQYKSATENARLAARRRLSRPLHWLNVRAKKRADWKLVKSSGSFDQDWYLENYPDVRGAGIDPIAHYLEYGAAEGRDPSPTFSSAGYLLQNPDALLSCVNPLVHHLRNNSPAKPGSALDSVNLNDYPRPDPGPGDVPRIEDLIEHFDPEFYLDTYPDILAAKTDPLRHYFDTGWRENRNPTTWFVTADYLRSNADVAGANVNPFWHYIKFGQHEGRLPKNAVDPRRRVLEHLHPPDENDIGTSVHDQDRVAEGALRSSLTSALKNSSGLAISFSHTSYVKQAAGTELFISDEQNQFNSRGFAYINLSPPAFSRLISAFRPRAL